MEWGATSRKR